MNDKPTFEPEKILRGLDSLNDRQKSYTSKAFLRAQDAKPNAFERVSHPRRTEFPISVHRDREKNLTHVHKNFPMRSNDLQSLIYTYEGIESHPIGKGNIPINSKNSVKSFNLGVEDCKNISPMVFPRNVYPEELYLKLAKVQASRQFGRRLVGFLRRNRNNLKWMKLTLKDSKIITENLEEKINDEDKMQIESGEESCMLNSEQPRSLLKYIANGMKDLTKLRSFVITLSQQGASDPGMYELYNRLSKCRYLENLSLGFGKDLISRQHTTALSQLLRRLFSLKSLFLYLSELDVEAESMLPLDFSEMEGLDTLWVRIQTVNISETDLQRFFWLWTQAKNLTEINLEVSNITIVNDEASKLKEKALPPVTASNQGLKKIRIKLDVLEKSAKFLYKLGKNFSQWTNLTELSISIEDKKFITGGYRALGRDLPYLVRLKSFTLNLPELSEQPHRNREGCFEIANAIQHFEDLEELNISINSSYAWDKTVDTYLFLKGLSLSFLKTRNLKKLTLSAKGNREVCSPSIEAISEGLLCLHGLKELSLKFNDLSLKDKDFQMLSKAIGQLKELEIVFVEYKNSAEFSDQSLSNLLLLLQTNRQLKGGAFFFDGNHLTREGLVEFMICLSQMKLSSYLFISLTRSKNINAQDLASIKKKARDKLFFDKSVRVKI